MRVWPGRGGREGYPLWAEEGWLIWGWDTGGQGEGAPREEVGEGMGCYW